MANKLGKALKKKSFKTRVRDAVEGSLAPTISRDLWMKEQYMKNLSPQEKVKLKRVKKHMKRK